MKTLLKNIFIRNWPRKLISIVLAIIIWFMVNQSLTSTKTISNIGVRINNIPSGKTIEGVESNGLLKRRVTLTLTGNKTLLEDLNSNDLEVSIDATQKSGEWIATITKRNLVPLNPDINLAQGISKISHKNFIIKLTKLVQDKIPIFITQPIGEAPKGYHFIDIWPYQLYVTVSGPEDVVKKLKARGVKLTFNLNDISKAQLDDLRVQSSKKNQDAVSFFVPNHWKQISLPMLSSTPIQIDDPNAKYLRIDFARYELIPIGNPIPVSLYFPLQFLSILNPQKINISNNKLIQTKNGIKMISEPLYAKGVSELFVEIMRDMLQIMIVVKPKKEDKQLGWGIQFVNPIRLEDRYVSTLMSDVADDEIDNLQPQVREEYLRNRFRNYMNRFRLFKPNDKKLDLSIELQGNSIIVTEKNNDN